MKSYNAIFLLTLVFITACTSALDSGSLDSGTPTGKTVYKDFDVNEYNQALADGKVVYLEFYANWCPVCRRQEPIIEAAFEELDNEDIIGFRIHYNDNQVSAADQDMARLFGVSYQYTKVVIDKDGNVAKKSIELWSKERIVNELNSVA